LIRAYMQISTISVKVSHEKTLQQDVWYMQSFLQNMSDNTLLDYAIYDTDLEEPAWLSQWIAYEIAFSGSVSSRVYQTGDCVPFSGDMTLFAQEAYGKKCRLEAVIDGVHTPISDPTSTYVSNISFWLLPQKYYSWDVLVYFSGDVNAGYRHSQWFWMFGYIRIRNPSTQRPTNSMYQIQDFYHID